MFCFFFAPIYMYICGAEFNLHCPFVCLSIVCCCWFFFYFSFTLPSKNRRSMNTTFPTSKHLFTHFRSMSLKFCERDSRCDANAYKDIDLPIHRDTRRIVNKLKNVLSMCVVVVACDHSSVYSAHEPRVRHEIRINREHTKQKFVCFGNSLCYYNCVDFRRGFSLHLSL